MRESSHSMQIATPSFMVTARGCAPPIPPRPAVRVIVPAREWRPSLVEPASPVIEPVEILSATAANVSNVPCRMPWVPM
jgi:hypothetical protein